MGKKQRVVVTGMGVCAPLGTSLDEFWANGLRGTPCVAPIPNFEVGDGFTRVAAMVPDFEPDSIYRPGQRPPQDDRVFLMARYCITKALENAQLSDPEHLATCGLFLSSAIGQMGSMESAFVCDPSERQRLYEKFSFGALVGTLARASNLGGGHLLMPTGCVGGCDALSYGAAMIQAGRCDRVVVGAAEAPITPLVVAAFGRIRANSTRPCDPREASCPFDKRRDGFVLAEGAAMFVLESEVAARGRAAKIYVEIGGSGSVNNCQHMTNINPDGDAIAASIRLSLKHTGLDPKSIDFINAHGSSTPQNDIAESAAFAQVFGRSLADIPVTSLKSQCGHALAAANAIEMVNTIQSISRGQIVPTINLEQQDPECRVTVVSGRSRSHRIRHALKVSSGFSGIHSAVVLSEYHA
jgi:3-oxoacyl-(acyl-carrier-protein) synthase